MADIKKIAKLAADLLSEIKSLTPAQGAMFKAAGGWEAPAVCTRLYDVKRIAESLVKEDHGEQIQGRDNDSP